ncbi:MAG: TIGR04168 family protein [Prochloraceae cyanobacterium]
MDRPKNSLKIAVIGDIHDLWEKEDNLALEHLDVNLALFVGDFGNESIEVVERIAALNLPKATVFGNHDAWYTASEWGRKKCPYDRTKEDRVRQQIDILGEVNVSYGKLDFPQLRLSVVGSRPFSWGGPTWRNKGFYRDRYGIESFEESTSAITTAAEATKYDNIIFLGHNGPFGLGDRPEDICGKDWQPIGGDYGDPDLADAISKVRHSGKNIPLVTFGHMHHNLRHTKDRSRTAVIKDEAGTIYYNSAKVPRIIDRDGQILRNFSIVTWENTTVTEIALIWVGENFQIVSEEVLYRDREIIS